MRAEEGEQLEEQKRQLQTKLRRRVPPILHSHGSGRKDSVQRQTELDLSEDLLVKPVGSRKLHDGSDVGMNGAVS